MNNKILLPLWGFPGSLDSKESACNVGDLGSILGLGRSPVGGDGNPLQYSCLENPHGQRSLVGYSPWGCKELDTTEWLTTSTTKEISKVLGALCQEPGTKIKSIFYCKHSQSRAWIPTLSGITWAKYSLWPLGSWSVNTPKKKKSVSHLDVNSSDPMDCSPPRSSVHGIPQARILERAAIPFSTVSSWSRDQTWVYCFAGRYFTIWTTKEAQTPPRHPQT